MFASEHGSDIINNNNNKLVVNMKIYLSMGCFWGPDELFSNIAGSENVSVGYASGTSLSGEQVKNREVVSIEVTDLNKVKEILNCFWRHHTSIQCESFPVPDKYKSSIFISENLMEIVKCNFNLISSRFSSFGHETPTTDIVSLSSFNKAEDKHQKFYIKHPESTCSLKKNGYYFI